VFLVYMYYVHPGYQTSIFGKNRAYYIQIFTVIHGSLGLPESSTHMASRSVQPFLQGSLV